MNEVELNKKVIQISEILEDDTTTIAEAIGVLEMVKSCLLGFYAKRLEEKNQSLKS